MRLVEVVENGYLFFFSAECLPKITTMKSVPRDGTDLTPLRKR
jgi:hypothetical protein